MGTGESDSAESAPQPIPQETDPGSAGHTAPVAVLSFPRLAFGLRAQKVGDTWSATVSNLNLARPTAAWLAARIEAQWMHTAEGRTKASGKTDRIVLDALWPLLAYLPESDAVARLRALNATGTLSDVSLTARRSTRCRLASRTCRLRRCNARRAPAA